MAESKILRGTMLLTAASFLSKFLGMIYVIPFNAMVGETGGALLSYAYVPYSIFISISTLGVPLAVSKFVSKYNALGDYETGRRMFRSGMKLMGVTGFIAFLIMFFSADLIAPLVKGDIEGGNSIEDIAMVIRMISFALLIIPAMSIVRGFFQGYQSMGPTAISQVVEQLVRIGFLLTFTYMIMKFYGNMPLAVGFASFAAFIGALASFIILLIYWKKRKPHLDLQLQQQKVHSSLATEDIFKELFAYAGPFVLVGVATPLYQLIDMLTFNRTMEKIGLGEVSEIAYAAIHMFGHKLVIIPVTLATGLSLAMLPAITKSFIANQRQQMFDQINQSLQIVMLLILPAAAGIMTLSYESYSALYDFEYIETTGKLLAWYAPVALLFALFTVSASILQGINKQKFALVSLGAGLFLKASLNVPLMMVFGPKGSIFGTALAVGTAVVLNLVKIKRSISFPMKQLVKRSILIGIFTAMMIGVVVLTRWLLSVIGLEYTDSRAASIVVLTICSSVGALFYLWLAYQSTLLERVVGNRIPGLDRLMKRKQR
ncbi:putative polysaccharide biosynthesis protein [Pontibacillus litoralis]|uniref:Spore cortex protein n=1 Tax=Pontibacillus litoralis JSM 072002 TaxID=1385512 RepID=A0A0A5GD85_9BACI|nr:polysaccharide biosynthesis protein [Pontibacillus litoralis]KGX89173.1 spore cortex protein [Pontibacillus litoralis JSM 072002]